jgi:hypothetical protein
MVHLIFVECKFLQHFLATALTEIDEFILYLSLGRGASRRKMVNAIGDCPNLKPMFIASMKTHRHLPNPEVPISIPAHHDPGRAFMD